MSFSNWYIHFSQANMPSLEGTSLVLTHFLRHDFCELDRYLEVLSVASLAWKPSVVSWGRAKALLWLHSLTIRIKWQRFFLFFLNKLSISETDSKQQQNEGVKCRDGIIASWPVELTGDVTLNSRTGTWPMKIG